MRVFKNRWFSRWAEKEGLSDEALQTAVDEIKTGLIDADLGGQIIKKRVAIAGKGKRSGIRTLLAYAVGDRAFFVYGFTKNTRDNISDQELKALKLLAKELLGYSATELTQTISKGALIEIEVQKP